MQRFTVQYGPPGRYFVRREKDKKVVLPAFDYKSDAIVKAETLNGWAITGSSEGYDRSRTLEERIILLLPDDKMPLAEDKLRAALSDYKSVEVDCGIAALHAANVIRWVAYLGWAKPGRPL